jgi:hypothetical protein
MEQFVLGCDMLRRSDLVRSVTLTARLDDITDIIPLLEEIADQAGVLMEMKGIDGSVALTLTSSEVRAK